MAQLHSSQGSQGNNSRHELWIYIYYHFSELFFGKISGLMRCIPFLSKVAQNKKAVKALYISTIAM